MLNRFAVLLYSVYIFCLFFLFSMKTFDTLFPKEEENIWTIALSDVVHILH